jgi:hypothetical protein
VSPDDVTSDKAECRRRRRRAIGFEAYSRSREDNLGTTDRHLYGLGRRIGITAIARGTARLRNPRSSGEEHREAECDD